MRTSFQACVLALAMCCTLCAGCAASRIPADMTDDGLMRVPSRRVGGVYRLPGASFVQYRRIMLEPPSVALSAGWQRSHPEVTAADVVRILTESAQLLREEFTRELVRNGAYELTDDLAPDVLIVNLSIQDLHMPVPEVTVAAAERHRTIGAVKMKIVGELRDAATGVLVGRLIIFENDDRYGYGSTYLASRATNAHERRVAFAKWSRLLNEALAVAKVERPR
jgi:hypothetical protein